MYVTVNANQELGANFDTRGLLAGPYFLDLRTVTVIISNK